MMTSALAFEMSVEDRERLIAAAFEARERAYSPYSKFRVGAALLSTKGDIIKGANIENASYGGTICAERTALVKAVSEGVKSFTAIAVVTDVKQPISPCGICRQFIREFCSLKTPILLVPSDYQETQSGILERTLGELLPDSFGPEHLDLPRE